MSDERDDEHACCGCDCGHTFTAGIAIGVFVALNVVSILISLGGMLLRSIR